MLIILEEQTLYTTYATFICKHVVVVHSLTTRMQHKTFCEKEVLIMVNYT